MSYIRNILATGVFDVLQEHIASAAHDHVWFWRSRLPHRKGQRCRVLVRGGSMNSILIEFEDGQRHITSRYAVRKTGPVLASRPIVYEMNDPHRIRCDFTKAIPF